MINFNYNNTIGVSSEIITLSLGTLNASSLIIYESEKSEHHNILFYFFINNILSTLTYKPMKNIIYFYQVIMKNPLKIRTEYCIGIPRYFIHFVLQYIQYYP